MTTTRVLLAFAAALALAAFAAQPASAQATLAGDIPPGGGVVPVEWSGGTIAALQVAAVDAGCDLSAVLLPTTGGTRHYVVGAPGFVNAEWSTQVGPEIEATPLLIVCDTPGLDSCTSGGLVADRIAGPGGAETPWEALEVWIRDLSQFPDALPDGTFVEAGVSDSRATWELVAHYGGAVVGRFNVVRDEFGWWFSGSATCFFG